MKTVNTVNKTTLAQFQTISQRSHQIVYFHEIHAKALTPMLIFENLQSLFKDDFTFLENLTPQETDRYSFLSFETAASFEVSATENLNAPQALTALRDFKMRHQYLGDPVILDKLTLLTGFLTHDAIRLFENIPNKFNETINQLPLVKFNLYRFNLCFDHENSTLLIGLLVEINTDISEKYLEAEELVNRMISVIFQEKAPAHFHKKIMKNNIEVTTEPNDEQYMDIVRQAKAAIYAGEVFQVVLSRTFKTSYHVSPHALYLALRQLSPSPFMFYFTIDGATIIGASPERLVRIHQQQVSVTPIAGTRRRMDKHDDLAIETSLLTDQKELAEHKMLVDLARNDVGRISKIGSVTVKNFLKVKHYSHVSHITSEVTGELADHIDAFDVLKATFPAGTLSGAPKIRALQLINELETSDRGLYGGIICRFDGNDNFDSCIAIRMAMLNEGMATIRTGAGIVFDSDPVKEKEETEQKACAMLSAIQHAHALEGVKYHDTHDR